MGQQIIQQPNGRYCIYSSIVENVTYYDLDRDELIQAFLERERARTEDHVDMVLVELKRGQKPYFQFTMDYAEMMAAIASHHGESDAEKLTGLMAKSEQERKTGD